jgi:hypothetical protein
MTTEMVLDRAIEVFATLQPKKLQANRSNVKINEAVLVFIIPLFIAGSKRYEIVTPIRSGPSVRFISQLERHRADRQDNLSRHRPGAPFPKYKQE